MEQIKVPVCDYDLPEAIYGNIGDGAKPLGRLSIAGFGDFHGSQEQAAWKADLITEPPAITDNIPGLHVPLASQLIKAELDSNAGKPLECVGIAICHRPDTWSFPNGWERGKRIPHKPDPSMVALQKELNARNYKEEYRLKLANQFTNTDENQAATKDEGPQNTHIVLDEIFANWVNNVASKDPEGSTRIVTVSRDTETGTYYVSVIGTSYVKPESLETVVDIHESKSTAEVVLSLAHKRDEETGRGFDMILAFAEDHRIVELPGGGTYIRYTIRRGIVTQERLLAETISDPVKLDKFLDSYDDL